MSDVSQILSRMEGGDSVAARELLPVVYDELRQLAAAQIARERPGQTLQPTALVHEAWLRLVGPSTDANFANRRHFFGAAAEAMRRILVDQARRKRRIKHGGGLQRVELGDPVGDAQGAELDQELLALDEALPRLAAEDPQAAEIVQLMYFVGLGRDEIARIVGITVHEVRQKWAYAKAWLRLELEGT